MELQTLSLVGDVIMTALNEKTDSNQYQWSSGAWCLSSFCCSISRNILTIMTFKVTFQARHGFIISFWTLT